MRVLVAVLNVGNDALVVEVVVRLTEVVVGVVEVLLLVEDEDDVDADADVDVDVGVDVDEVELVEVLVDVRVLVEWTTMFVTVSNTFREGYPEAQVCTFNI